MNIKSVLAAAKNRQLVRFIKERVALRYAQRYRDDFPVFLSILFRQCVGYRPNFEVPRSLNEKLNWLKLHWRSDLARLCSDKNRVAEYVKSKGLASILVPRYGLYRSLEEIDFNQLPRSFVLKATHDSGGVWICRNKSLAEFEQGKKKIARRIASGSYGGLGEWFYDGIEPRILVEKLIDTGNGRAPADYKIFCFHGVPRFLFVATDRDANCKFDFFDLDWNLLPVKQGHPTNGKINRPALFGEMLEVARVLSADFPHVRVDLYAEGGKVYFGELTFCHFSGLVPFEPREYDFRFGEFLSLEKIPRAELV